jgi:hypothetical protein
MVVVKKHASSERATLSHRCRLDSWHNAAGLPSNTTPTGLRCRARSLFSNPNPNPYPNPHPNPNCRPTIGTNLADVLCQVIALTPATPDRAFALITVCDGTVPPDDAPKFLSEYTPEDTDFPEVAFEHGLVLTAWDNLSLRARCLQT